AEECGDPEGGDDQARAAIHPAEPLGSERRPEKSDAHAQDEPPERRARNDTEHHRRGGAVAADASTKPEAGEDGREGEDGGGIGEGEGEGRGPRGGQPASVRGNSRRRARYRHPRAYAQIAEKDATARLQPHTLLDEGVRHQREPKGGHRAVDRVGGGRAQTRGEADGAAVGEGATDAEHADGPDGRGDGQADDQASHEDGEIHRAARTPWWARAAGRGA